MSGARSICIAAILILICGCSHFSEGYKARPSFQEANDLSSRGSYRESLDTYEEIIRKYPTTGDRALFEMGVVYAHAKNEQRDYQKALECFQKLINDYPESSYRRDSEMMVFYINNVSAKDNVIAARNKMVTEQQQQIETLRQEVKSKEKENAALQKKVEALGRKVSESDAALQGGPADRILVKKKERRLMLMANGEVLKTYRIALGGNPIGPKEREGDNKTPEGTYFIDSRNRDSLYHLSLHLSYPNETDKKRAKERGVSPGGDIMIHGIKNGFSWVGNAHAKIDWTKGCIAVTDEEIEEIGKLAPNGTVVEIRP